MNRRANVFALVVLGGTAVAWPFAGRAQQRLPVIGYLDSSSLPVWFDAFQDGLDNLGYVQGRTVAIESRAAAGQASRLRDLAAELVRLQPKVIVASGSAAAAAAKRATATIPIVFTFATDPIALGLVTSLARPGGNVTGQSNQAPGLVGKRLQVLAEVLPGVSHFGVVWSPSSSHVDFREMQAAAVTLRLALDSFEVRQPDDVDAVFKKAADRTGGVAVLSGPLIFTHRDAVVAAAARHKVPAIYYDEEYSESGGLVSYGPSLRGLHRSAAILVDKILKGAKPGDLPVEQPTRFELVVNRKAANALGLTLPESVVRRADRVIE
ncbi:MAG TPA: ABC transporter substrate-binding protein [Casimicrobiaceae bacterium]|nr:ABC transporter substrate-binding protein [Casimicrobiaceae bacterium]